eukprot:4313756-Pleurochrysis_carterae.AAC.8
MKVCFEKASRDLLNVGVHQAGLVIGSAADWHPFKEQLGLACAAGDSRQYVQPKDNGEMCSSSWPVACSSLDVHALHTLLADYRGLVQLFSHL